MQRIIKEEKDVMYEPTSTRRDELKIMLDILNFSKKPIKKTHLLYKANLNFNQFQKYLNMLQTLGLIEKVHSPFSAYKITNKGEMFVTSLNPSESLNVHVSN